MTDKKFVIVSSLSLSDISIEHPTFAECITKRFRVMEGFNNTPWLVAILEKHENTQCSNKEKGIVCCPNFCENLIAICQQKKYLRSVDIKTRLEVSVGELYALE